MATVTANIGLTKPGYTDSAEVGVLNANFDIIDGKIGDLLKADEATGTTITDLGDRLEKVAASIETLTASVKEINTTLVGLDERLKKLEPQTTASQDAQGVDI